MIVINNQINWKKTHKALYIIKKLGLKKIGSILNVSGVTVYKNFKKNSLKIRTHKEAAQNLNYDLEKHPNWKGGTYFNKAQGRYLRCVGKGKYMQESVYQYIKAHKLDKISKGFVVHHIDFNKKNNKIENLQLLSRSAHTILHNRGGQNE